MGESVINNWERISSKTERNSIFKQSCEASLVNGWANDIKNTCDRIGLLKILYNIPNSKTKQNIQVFNRERDMFLKDAITKMQIILKFKTYTQLESDISIENVLTLSFLKQRE